MRLPGNPGRLRGLTPGQSMGSQAAVANFQFHLPDIKSVAKFLGAYGAGVVTAGFFLSGPGEYAGSYQPAQPAP
jgi:hypothetical protein